MLQDLNSKLYGGQIIMKPVVNNISLGRGKTTNVVTFSFKEMILRMVLNKSLFTPSNLLLDHVNPWSGPPESEDVGVVNTRTWIHRIKK